MGTILRTTDAGKTWIKRPVTGASESDFRDIEAFDDRVAYALAIGEGEKSRIYQTVDGGATWVLQHINREPKGFLDAIAFWDKDHGLAMGDPVDGHYMILATDDGGKTWNRLPTTSMPPALKGEGAFAASGTCLMVQGDSNVWFGTGSASVARVFRSTDRGRSWTVHDTPIRTGTATSGIFSLAFRDASHGVIVGGSYDQADRKGNIVATTSDGGIFWSPVKVNEPAGFRSAVAFVDHQSLITVGPSGSDYSIDEGRSWKTLGKPGFHALGLKGSDVCWAVGEFGRIARYDSKSIVRGDAK
jgi:photosystem II stability/assembly factor-like uncharacterized protein